MDGVQQGPLLPDRGSVGSTETLPGIAARLDIPRPAGFRQYTPLSHFQIRSYTCPGNEFDPLEELTLSEIADDREASLEQSGGYSEPDFPSAGEQSDVGSDRPGKKHISLAQRLVKMLVSGLLGMESTHSIFTFISYKELQYFQQCEQALKNRLRRVQDQIRKTTDSSATAELVQQETQLKEELIGVIAERKTAEANYKKDRANFSRLVSALKQLIDKPGEPIAVHTAGIVLNKADGDICLSDISISITALSLQHQETGIVQAQLEGHVAFTVRMPLFGGEFLSLKLEAKDAEIAFDSGLAGLINLYGGAKNIVSLLLKSANFAASRPALTPKNFHLQARTLTVELVEGSESSIARIIQKARNTTGSAINRFFTECDIPLNLRVETLNVVDRCGLGVSGEAEHLNVTLNPLVKNETQPHGESTPVCNRHLLVKARKGVLKFSNPVGSVVHTLDLVAPQLVSDNPVKRPKASLKDVAPVQTSTQHLAEITGACQLTLEQPEIDVVRVMAHESGEEGTTVWNLKGHEEVLIRSEATELSMGGKLSGTLKSPALYGHIAFGRGEGLAISLNISELKSQFFLGDILASRSQNSRLWGDIRGNLGELGVCLTVVQQERKAVVSLGPLSLSSSREKPLQIHMGDRSLKLNSRDSSVVRTGYVDVCFKESKGERSLVVDPVRGEVSCKGCVHVPPQLCRVFPVQGRAEISIGQSKYRQHKDELGNDYRDVCRSALAPPVTVSFDRIKYGLGTANQGQLVINGHGEGSVSEVEIRLQGDKVLDVVQGVADMWLLPWACPGLTLKLSLSVPIKDHGVASGNLRLRSINIECDDGQFSYRRIAIEGLLKVIHAVTRCTLSKKGRLMFIWAAAR